MGIAVTTAVVLGEQPVRVETVSDATGVPAETRTPLGHGIQHPEFSTMQVGGDGEARLGPILWVGWFFGISQIAMFVAMLALGMRKKTGLGPTKVLLLLGLVIFAGIFTLLVLSYRSFMLGDNTDIVLGFPIPTAWMIYGIWLFPIFFVILYVLKFNTWYLTDADLKRFQGLLEETKRKRRNNQPDSEASES